MQHGLKNERQILWHGITIIVAVGYTLVLFFAAGLPMLFDSSYNPILSSTPLHTAQFGLHAIFGFSALGAGLWLIALWRPKVSTEFAVRSKRIAQVLAVLWVLAYVVGITIFLTFNVLNI